MVNKIPEEFWERKYIKMLDPCAGNGNFPAFILNKVKNDFVLQINEISEKRIINVKNIFKESENIIITEKDFLQFDSTTTYDLVIANPPYALIQENKRAAKNHSIFKDFIKKGLDVLNENGYLVFIIPDSWMSLSDRNDIPKLLSNYQFIYLNIHGAKKYFKNVGSSFTWFVLKKAENTQSFIIDNFYKKEEESITFLKKNIECIPLFYNDKVKSIIEKTLYANNKKFAIETTSDLHKYTKRHLISSEKNNEFVYELVHTQSQRVFSKVPHKFQDGWKVFISLTSYYSLFVDKDVGMTQSIAFIRVKDEEEANKIKNILEHPLFLFLNNIHRYGNFNNIRILQKFPYTDSDAVWDAFSITDDERVFIESFLQE